MKHTFESIIKDIYNGHDILEVNIDDVALTKYIIHLFDEYHIDISRPDIKQSFLARLKDSTNQFWVKPYIKIILSDVVEEYALPGIRFLPHSCYFNPDKYVSDIVPSDYEGDVFLLQDLYHAFKSGQYRYDFCVHDIIRSEQLIKAFSFSEQTLLPIKLDQLIDLMYTDIVAFENNEIIRHYLKIISEEEEHYVNVSPGLNVNYLDEFDFDKIKKPSLHQRRFKLNYHHVIMNKQDLNMQKAKEILINIKQRYWFVESFLTKKYKQSKLSLLKNQYILKDSNISLKQDIVNKQQIDKFYFSNKNPDYNCDTDRDYKKDQHAAPLLYEIQTIYNKDPEPYRHLLYFMYGSDSDIIKIGRTMNGTERIKLYQAPINQNDSHFNNDEVVMLLGFDYSYGDYKPYNNYKNGLSLGTAKFFTAEYILKQLLYSYCERSSYIEKFEKGKEWFRFRQNVSDINKAKVVRLIEKLIVKANKVVEAASDDCISVTEVKKEIEYDEKRDINKWLNEILMD